jgi:peptidoglycan/LPS O-acetylase OafA/YrhL
MSLRTGAGTPWHLDRGRRAGEMGYLPGLDGIRAVAIIGVLLYHADLDWLPGGFLGVDVFFVLSGFLITTLILEEFDRSGRVDFGRFYLGRARRLLPALVLMLVVCGIAVAFVYRDAASQFARDALASVFYVNNWLYILTDQSYFEFTGRPPLLQHLWSLAVEEQFYLVWPAIAYLVVRRFARRGVLVVAGSLAVLSTGWMLWLSVQNGYPDLADPSRAYFGTDSHIMGLLVGAALACVWRPGRLRAQLPSGARVLILATGVASLLAVLAFYAFVTEYTAWMYRGGFLGLSVIVAVLIATATHPAVPLGRALGTQPLRFIGQRSYGLYLWHWPVFMVTRPGLDVPIDGIGLLALQLGLTFGIAELSYRYVEMPIRRGAIDRWVARLRDPNEPPRTRTRLRLGTGVAAGACAVALGVLAATLVTAPQAGRDGGPAPDVAEAMGIASGGPTEVTLDGTAPPERPAPASSGQASTMSASPSPSSARDNGRVSAIGDSVMLGARRSLQTAIPGTRVDASVARFPGGFIGPLKRYVRADRLAPVVVLHPGTNGVLPESMMREMLDILADSPRVVVVNTNMPRKWRAPNNAVIEKVVADYPNAVLADWYSASKGKREYFVSDGIHLSRSGANAYAELIRQATGL